MEGMCDRVVQSLRQGRPVAMGFECPLFVPTREEPARLAMARAGEGSHSWSAGAGAGALSTGLVQTHWLLSRLRLLVEVEPQVWFDWTGFQSAGQGLFLWEAFVVGHAKGESHCDDAEIAVEAFHRCLPDPAEHNMIEEPQVLSLLGTALLRAGWAVEPSVISQPCLVIAGDAGL